MTTKSRGQSVLDELYPEFGAGVKDTATGPYPWSGDLRGDDKTRIFRYLLNIPEGTPISTLVEHIFDSRPADNEKEYQRNYKFTERFVDGCPVLKIDRGQQYLHCEPKPTAFHLKRPKHSSNNADGVGVGQYPKEFAEDFLETIQRVTDARAQMLEKQFVSYREQINDRFNILRAARDDVAPKYLLVPYATRFNSDARSSENWSKYHRAWRNATREYNKGVALTLTTDPKKFDSLKEMCDSIFPNFNRFMSWLRRKLAHRCSDLGTPGHNLHQCAECEEYGERPDYICALEFTEQGFPHLHVSLFGIDWIADQSVISDYWEQYQAEVVHVKGMSKRLANGSQNGVADDDGKEWIWLTSGEGDKKAKNEKAHQGKYLAEAMPTNESIADLQEQVEADDSDLWKTAMFWASNKQFWTAAEDLKQPSDDDDDETELPIQEIANYVFVGAAKSGDIPKHVWETSVKMIGSSRGKDPPSDQ